MSSTSAPNCPQPSIEQNESTIASPAAATALASLYARDKTLVDRAFNHLTQNALELIDKWLLQEYDLVLSSHGGTAKSLNEVQKEEQCNLALAQSCIRRIVYRCLDKYSRLFSSPDVVEDALKCYSLPEALQQQLASKYSTNDHPTQPTTWYEALQQLKFLASDEKVLDQDKLWRLILEHPMTAYIPVQCQRCGHVVPDHYPLQQTDADVGIKEVSPTGTEIEIRAGLFRGPRKAVVFELTCPDCKQVSMWYRSGHPKVILNPNKWGRLCGEQEDLRLTLAEYLNIPLRLVCPLDWDHVWSEYQTSPTLMKYSPFAAWKVEDGSARNFCRRLDEGIGSWTRVWAIHPNPEWCQDVTHEYLKYQKDGGRADDREDEDDDAMNSYKQAVKYARNDSTGSLTQANTCNGYILARANFTDDDVTVELRRAATEYGSKEWWQLHV